MIKIILLIVCLLAADLIAVAQTDSTQQRHTIAVFAPLYLDSAFDASGEYTYGKNFPKFLNPGLEFYEGIQLAADSLTKTGAPLDIHVYDTRSVAQSIAQTLQKPELAKVELIIGHVTGSEIKVLAEIAKTRSIPFINVNVPNDANITNNPFFIILNSTLKTHLQAIYKFLQRSYSTSPIIVFRKNGPQEELLMNYFIEIERATAAVPLKLEFVTLSSTFTASQLASHLDSTRENMCVAASLDETFAKRIAQQLASLNKAYPLQLMGMPTWDGIKDLEKKEYKGLNIIYSTPFYNAKTDKASTSITGYFKNNFYSRPSDMVFRGYECIMRFGRLLIDHGVNIGSSISEKKYKVFTDFDIQPVFLNKQTPTLDYFENKKVYFVKLTDGDIKAVY